MGMGPHRCASHEHVSHGRISYERVPHKRASLWTCTCSPALQTVVDLSKSELQNTIFCSRGSFNSAKAHILLTDYQCSPLQR
jgi:hypothetical protein